MSRCCPDGSSIGAALLLSPDMELMENYGNMEKCGSYYYKHIWLPFHSALSYVHVYYQTLDSCNRPHGSGMCARFTCDVSCWQKLTQEGCLKSHLVRALYHLIIQGLLHLFDVQARVETTSLKFNNVRMMCEFCAHRRHASMSYWTSWKLQDR